MADENLLQPEEIKQTSEPSTASISPKPKNTCEVSRRNVEDSSEVKKKKYRLYLSASFVGIILAATLVFAGYQLGQSRPDKTKPSSTATSTPIPLSTPTSISTSTPLPTPTPDAIADWKTYTNTQYGYSIKYPENWYVTEPEGGSEKGRRMNFHPWQKRSFDKVDYEISIIVTEINYEESLASWLDKKLEVYSEEVRKLITRQKIILNNLEGEKVLREPSLAGVYNFYTKKGTFVYNFMLAPYSPENLPQLLPESLDYFNLMLSTFKFLN